MENLDAMWADDLIEFWDKYKRPSRKQAILLFEGKHDGYIKAAKACAHYASNKAAAIQCRTSGDMDKASQYEAICERIYKTLPPYARW